jgi:amphi-Trp domain-containing protein
MEAAHPMGKDTFEFARIATPEEIAEYLTSLAVGLKRGEVTLESGGQSLRLAPGGDLKLELKVKRKHEKGKIELELRWKSGEATRAAGLQVQAGVRPQ